ncbi:hypothetical protein [Microlunatus parietis]|uniref:Uncharacterized protein n=1 Tax=Microlunatus parietis TaxID=682979 RepID=A0A7Y9L8H9_9ACTN|nr:hypothetical protein [Microlunatus parietis]NYE70784.1 hypothetical protein [Microlunatus parietis]
MSITSLAGLAGLGFVLLAVVINVVYLRVGLPMPGARLSLAATEALAGAGQRIKAPSVFAPAGWLCTTLFAAGLLGALWRHDQLASNSWALVGFAGVLMQNAAFMVVEALRFGMAEAARQGRASVAGLWVFGNVLFGFNQVFLAVAVLGFTAAGATLGLIPAWHAWLGWISAALLFASATVAPYNADGTNRVAVIGLIGWLGWAAWIVAYAITLLRL